MNEPFQIFIDRLHDGVVEAISFEATPDFLSVTEKELKFLDPVEISGEAYLAESELVFRLSVSTMAQMPCSICNQETKYPIQIDNLYYTKPLSEISGHTFDFSEGVREAVLLEVPFVVECNGGNCPERKNIEKFLAPPEHQDEDRWQPFKDL